MAAGEARLVDEQRGIIRPVRVERIWKHNKKSIIKFEGIDSIEDAGKIKGCRLEMPVDQLKPLEEGEFYIKDLIGLEARLETGEKLGKIINVMPTGGKDVLVIEGRRGEVMIPFTEEFAGQPDPEKQEIVVFPPEGLLDIYEI
jgi:16S rRNA processing protein RimM